jgi:hypothetical protein
MALATGLTGDGILIDSTATTRQFNVWVGLIEQLWEETTTVETREWVALTQAAAEAAVAANVQPVGDGTYTWSAAEQQRVVGSYSVKRISEIKEYQLVGG